MLTVWETHTHRSHKSVWICVDFDGKRQSPSHTYGKHFNVGLAIIIIMIIIVIVIITMTIIIITILINHPFWNGLYQISMAIWGMVYYCFTRITTCARLLVSERHLQMWMCILAAVTKDCERVGTGSRKV